MAKTFFEASLWSPEESWRTVRNLRANPPPAVVRTLSKNGRCEAFHMSLEQSEQLFRAAADMPVDARPILLFYALGQAMRALVAGSPRLTREEWTASKHGTSTNLSEIKKEDVWLLQTETHLSSDDLFSRASLALGSPNDIGAVSLGAAASNLQEFAIEYREFDTFPRVLEAPTLRGFEGSDSSSHTHTEVPLRLTADDEVEELTATVPALCDFLLVRDDTGRVRRDHNDCVLVQVPTDALVPLGLSHTVKGAQMYRGHAVLTRKMGNGSGPVHPLMIWWLVLFPLSMLARYEPRKWRFAIDLNRSNGASQIEYLCDRALDSVPQLLAESLAWLPDDAPMEQVETLPRVPRSEDE